MLIWLGSLAEEQPNAHMFTCFYCCCYFQAQTKSPGLLEKEFLLTVGALMCASAFTCAHWPCLQWPINGSVEM